MSEAMDPAIKLFGRTIPLPEGQMPPDPGEPLDPASVLVAEAVTEGEVEDLCGEITKTGVRAQMLDIPGEIDRREPASSSGLSSVDEGNHQTSTQEVELIVDPKTDQNQAEDSNSGQEKLMKKPDKILPCPRCKSMDTKFCYYNNYNVNQPRHFCKNCQRYWTAGGAMRNVPVGAGRRKTKHSLSQRHVMMIADRQPCAHLDTPSSAQHHVLSGESSAPVRPLKGNGAVLNFGPEAPLCESVASVLSLGDQERSVETKSEASLEKKEESTQASSTIDSNHVENEGSKSAVHKEQNVTVGYSNGITPMHHLPCYPGPPLVFPWSPNPIPWAQPIFTASAVTYQYMPAPFWGCMSNWPNGAWSVPWLQTHGHLSPSSATSDNNYSWNESPTLGKHSRDTDKDEEDNAEKKSLWVPKTLRINDPDEAAKSSIWATLGIKPNESFRKGRTFKDFQPRTANKDVIMNASQVLKANPAALCRSQTFQEST